VFDIEDLTNCRVESATFFGLTKKNLTFKDLFQFVASRIFELDRDILLRDLLRTKLKVTRQEGDIRAPIDLGDGYFIEGALSGKEILRRVKLMLQSSEIEDELFLEITQLDG